jgi:hypothetical protein
MFFIHCSYSSGLARLVWHTDELEDRPFLSTVYAAPRMASVSSPEGDQPVLVRSDSAGGSSKLAWHLRAAGWGSR